MEVKPKSCGDQRSGLNSKKQQPFSSVSVLDTFCFSLSFSYSCDITFSTVNNSYHFHCLFATYCDEVISVFQDASMQNMPLPLCLSSPVRYLWPMIKAELICEWCPANASQKVLYPWKIKFGLFPSALPAIGDSVLPFSGSSAFPLFVLWQDSGHCSIFLCPHGINHRTHPAVQMLSPRILEAAGCIFNAFVSIQQKGRHCYLI